MSHPLGADPVSGQPDEQGGCTLTPVPWDTVRDVLAEYLCADWSDDEGLGCADEPPCWSHYVEAGEALTALGAEPPPDCAKCGHPVTWHGETGENQCKRRDIEGHRCICQRNMPNRLHDPPVVNETPHMDESDDAREWLTQNGIVDRERQDVWFKKSRELLAPSAPTGDHGGLREAVEALAEEWDAETYPATGDPGFNNGYDMARESAADRLLAALAAHPEPEPAQVGEVARLLAEHPGWTQEVDEERTDMVNGRWVYWRARCSGRGCLELLQAGTGHDDAHRAHLAAVLVAAGVTR